MTISFATGFCTHGYRINLYATKVLFEDPLVQFIIPVADPPAPPPTGTTPVTAWPGSAYGLRTETGSFEIVQLDLPTTSSLRLAGRMLINMDAWNIDFVIDAMTDVHTCF